jgi:signal transduction histidine kinase
VATGERQRLAREIHDLVAHSLAVTMLHLTGARLALKDAETDEAIDALDEAERAGREAMAEIRRTVGLLGPAESGAATPPTPKAVDVPALVGDFRTAGLEVEAHLNGCLESVPLTAGVALYRIVQESLSNAVKHASGQPVRLEVHVASGVVRATISNPLATPFVSSPQGSDGGHGVRGMSERAKALDGALQAGSQARTWVVEATIPMGASGS